MSKKYIYEDERHGKNEFIVTEPSNYSMKITKDGRSIIISIHDKVETAPENLTLAELEELAGKYQFHVEADPGVSAIHETVQEAVNFACMIILEKLRLTSHEEQLYSQLRDFYDKLED